MRVEKPRILHWLLIAVLAPVGVMGQSREEVSQPGAVPGIGRMARDPVSGTGVVESARLFREPIFSFAPEAPARWQGEASRRPPAEGSMTGYIDSAIVGSQFRVRFDAGFDNRTPDLGEYFYAKCRCYRFLETLVPAAFDPSAPGPGPGVTSSQNFQQLYFNAEYAPDPRLSVFAEVPVRWLQPKAFANTGLPSWGTQAGLSDIRVGFKAGVVVLENSSVTFQLKAVLPTGDSAIGMGTNNLRIEPAVLYNQRLGARVVLESQFGISVPRGGSDGVPTATDEDFASDIFFYGIGPSVEVYSSDNLRLAPVVELVGWHLRNGFHTQIGGPISGVAAPADGIHILNVKFGMRVGFGNRNSFYGGYGKALTDDLWYDDILRLEYRASF